MHRQADEDAPAPVPGSPGSLVPTLIRLSSSGVRVPEGQDLVLAAQVRTVGAHGLSATGSVQFLAGGVILGSAPLDEAGQAVLGHLRLPPGVHAITASYAGDDRHAAATSTLLPQAVVASAAPMLVLVGAPLPVPEGVLLEAELVDPTSGRLADDATGRLVFSAGNATLGEAELLAGHARLVVASLPPGRLRASFGGDPEHAPASGASAAGRARP